MVSPTIGTTCEFNWLNNLKLDRPRLFENVLLNKIVLQMSGAHSSGVSGSSGPLLRLSVQLVSLQISLSYNHFTFKMPFKFSLTSHTSGEMFKSTYDAFVNHGIVPTTRLASDHPFNELWQEHLAELIKPGLYDTVIDALADLAEGAAAQGIPEVATSSQLPNAKGDGIRQLLATHPPNVVVSHLSGSYGRHFRRENLWPFICVSEGYVSQWMTAAEDSETKLALLALLKTALDHGIGHWLFTLVSIGTHPILNSTNSQMIESWLLF